MQMKTDTNPGKDPSRTSCPFQYVIQMITWIFIGSSFSHRSQRSSNRVYHVLTWNNANFAWLGETQYEQSPKHSVQELTDLGHILTLKTTCSMTSKWPNKSYQSFLTWKVRPSLHMIFLILSFLIQILPVLTLSGISAHVYFLTSLGL